MTDKCKHGRERAACPTCNPAPPIRIVALDIPFLSLVAFLVKASFASMVAAVVTGFIWLVLGTAAFSLLVGLGAAVS